jgi:hypothetical protein
MSAAIRAAILHCRDQRDLPDLPLSGSMPAGKSRCDVVDGDVPSRDGHDELVCRVVWRVEVDVVEAIEHNDGKPAETLVPVDERVVAHEGIEQCRCLAVPAC